MYAYWSALKTTLRAGKHTRVEAFPWNSFDGFHILGRRKAHWARVTSSLEPQSCASASSSCSSSFHIHHASAKGHISTNINNEEVTMYPVVVLGRWCIHNLFHPIRCPHPFVPLTAYAHLITCGNCIWTRRVYIRCFHALIHFFHRIWWIDNLYRVFKDGELRTG